MGNAAGRRHERAAPRPPRQMTLLDLVASIAASAESDAEVVSAVAKLINSGRITLVGNFRGADVRVG